MIKLKQAIKYFILILIPFSSISLLAQRMVSGKITEAGLCESGNCSASNSKPNQSSSDILLKLQQIQKISEAISSPVVQVESQRAYLVSLKQGWTRGEGNRCDAFVNQYGMSSLGVRLMSDLKQEPLNQLVTKTKDMNLLCPNYDHLSEAQRKMLLLVILKGMSFYESSCTSTATNGGAPNGRAMGLLQLHAMNEHKYADSKFCPKNASYSLEQSLTCGLAMLSNQVVKSKEIFNSNSYWEVLRPNRCKGAKCPSRHTDKIQEGVKLYCNSIAKETKSRSQTQVAVK